MSEHEEGAFHWDKLETEPRRTSLPSRRPNWVILIFVVYVALTATLVLGPLILAPFFDNSPGAVLAAMVFAAAVFACGASLLVIPVGHDVPRPKTKRSILLPLIGSATLAAFLFFGFAIAAHEFRFGGKEGDSTREEEAENLIWIAVPAVWVIWIILFGTIDLYVERSMSNVLSKTLLVGSVAELLVAIPMHLVVRGRGYCCAGLSTGIGIGIGLIVMLVALGPAVFFLCFQRYRQVYARKTMSEGE